MGGLGNQLFQIFTVIAYSIQNGQKIVFPYSKQLGKRNTYWDTFLLTLKSFTTANTKYNISNGNIPIDAMYKEPFFHYQPIPVINSSKTLRIDGYFQSYKYFENERATIFNMLRITAGLHSIRTEFSKYFADDSVETISMHFRLGDYVNLPLYHPIMSYAYYESALSNICGRNLTAEQELRNIEVTDTETSAKVSINNKVETFKLLRLLPTELSRSPSTSTCGIPARSKRVLYFCEENDNAVVLEMINKLKQKYNNIEFVKVDDTIIDWKQMLIMSCCNHNIIANSSFSWWGAYFNKSVDKIVCYPSKWFGTNLSENDTKDMCPESWHKIDC